jgi:transcriptional regulator with XRE-family HTH domain
MASPSAPAPCGIDQDGADAGDDEECALGGRRDGLLQASAAAAAALGIRQTLVSKMELGERRLDPVELARFAAVYGKPVAWFLDAD